MGTADKMIVDKDNIESLIPQKYPMIMVDNLIYFDEKLTRTNFNIKSNNIFVYNGFFCEPGIIENIAQTAAVRAGYCARLNNLPVKEGYIGAIKNLKIHFLPPVNSEIITEIKMENQILGITIVSGKILCEKSLVADCEMRIFINEDS